MSKKTFLILILLLLSTNIAYSKPMELNGGKYEVINLKVEYIGEERGQAKYWKEMHEKGEIVEVEYINDLDERKKYKVEFKEGKLLYSNSGEPVMANNHLYVIDKNGDFYIWDRVGEKGKYHHSTILAGEPVVCAGAITVVDGKLVTINNHSGHYKPELRHFKNALRILLLNGIDNFKASNVTGYIKTFNGMQLISSDVSLNSIEIPFREKSLKCFSDAIKNAKNGLSRVKARFLKPLRS